MRLLGLDIRRDRALQAIDERVLALEQKQPPPLQPITGTGWFWPWVRESFLGAWQQNTEVRTTDILTYSAVFACVTLIASDIGKLRIKLMRELPSGIWEETSSPAFSPVLRKQNAYQTRIMFLQNWMTSKLIWGNTYVLKVRDNRRVVTGLKILDSQRVTVLVDPSGNVWYQLQTDNLAQVPIPERQGDIVAVPASEIIHDVYVPLYHPLIGISPLTACGLAAMQALRIQDNSAMFFGNGSRPGGVLTAPGQISDAAAARLKAYFDTNFSGENAGKVAVLGDGLTYEQMTMSAVDAQLIEQLKWTAEDVCRAFRVPPYMIGIPPMPTYNNIEALNAQYYTQCLQNHIESIEILLDEGVLAGAQEENTGRLFGTELDLDDLLRMDTASRMEAAEKAIKAGLSPNEVRAKYHDAPPVSGGESPMMQQQNFSLKALAERDKDKPFAKPEPAPSPPAASAEPDTEESVREALLIGRAFMEERLQKLRAA